MAKREGLHHGGLQGKSGISNAEVRDVMVIVRKWFIWGKFKGACIQRLFQITLIVDSSIRVSAVCTNIHPDELVVSIDQAEQKDGKEPL